MRASQRLLSPARISAVCLGGAISLILAGCGAGLQEAAVSTVSTAPGNSAAGPVFGGKLYGGPVPIVGATVKLYATGSSSPGTSSDGYGVGTLLAEAAQQGTSAHQDTNANGDFIFNTTYTCPAKQFAYVVATGGNGGGGVNTAISLVAAVGRCEDLTTSTVVYVNELTTIAAAYALGHFATVSGSAGSGLVVSIGAPVTNNSQTFVDGNMKAAGCVSNAFYTTALCPTTSANGLYHAFLNALNLMPTTTYSSNAPTTIPNPGLAAGGTVLPSIPAALLNTMANSLVACVNSTGPASNPCLIVLAAGGGATNVFQAMVNIAANPTLAGTGQTPYSFLATGSSNTAVYFPTLANYSTGLTDLSIGINYPKGVGANSTNTSFQGLYYPFTTGIDINDVAYVGNQTASGTGPGNIIAFSSNGSLLSYTQDSASTQPRNSSVVPDAIGNIYDANSSTTSPSTNVVRYTVSNGIINATPTTITGLGNSSEFIAVDRLNNAWITTTSSGTATTYNVYKLAAGTTAATGAFDTNNTGSTVLAASYATNIAVDPNQNIWVTDYATANPTVSVLQNTGTAAAPTYTLQSGITGSGSAATLGTTPVYAATVNDTLTQNGPWGIAFIPSTAASGYAAWITTGAANPNPGITGVTPTLVGAAVTSFTNGTYAASSGTTAQTSSYYNTADGNGTVFTMQYTGSSVMVTNTVAGTNTYLKPCVLATATTSSCSTNPFNVPRGIAIDSTGSIWVAGATGDNEMQIIGTAAPTWPLLSLGLVGKP